MADEMQARLLRVAEEIAEGTPVDWEAELEGADPETSRRLRRLRIVQEVGRTHGSIDDVATSSPTHELVTPDEPERLDLVEREPPAPLPDGWGALEIVERLGAGGYGEVLRAFDPALQTDVALKLLYPGTSGTTPDEFLAEARKLARVRHPNVVVVHGAAMHDGRAGLWTELIEGRSLEQQLAEDGPLAAREAAAIGIDLCRALAAVHGAGVIHRDVKASNVMRETGGRIVLLDFSAGTERDAVRPAPVSGTPQYMAPEVLRGRDSGTSADIYSLGVLLYRLVSGAYPLIADGLPALIDGHERGAYVRLLDARPDLPAAFVRVVERALDPDPKVRFATAAELEAALAATIDAVPGPVPPSPSVRSRARQWALAAAGVAAAVLLVAWIVSAPAAPLDVDADWFRLRGGVEERLLPGAAIDLGDCLVLDIEGSRDMHVYVMNEDGSGTPSALFPRAAYDTLNPLPRGVEHRLPGPAAGRAECWPVSSRGGEETMIVVASVEPLAELEAELARVVAAGPTLADSGDDPAPGVRLRGVSGRRQVPERPQSLAGMTGRLQQQAGGRQGVWVWELKLDSGGP